MHPVTVTSLCKNCFVSQDVLLLIFFPEVPLQSTAVIDCQLRWPYIENVLSLSVLTKRSHCLNLEPHLLAVASLLLAMYQICAALYA